MQFSVRAAFLPVEDLEVLQALGFEGFVPGRDVNFDQIGRALVDYVQFKQ